MNNVIKLARAQGLIQGTQGALASVLMEIAGLSETDALETLKQVNKILNESRELIGEVANNLQENQND